MKLKDVNNKWIFKYFDNNGDDVEDYCWGVDMI